MLYYLIYISKAAKPMNDDDLKQLLYQSRTNNEALQLTGMLLYLEGTFLGTQGGRFIQVLEGNKEDVKSIFNKIKEDPRHYNVNLLNEAELKKRYFKTWTMGFDLLNNQSFEQTEGFFDIDNLFNPSTKDGIFNLPLSYLRSFYSMHAQRRSAS